MEFPAKELTELAAGVRIEDASGASPEHGRGVGSMV